MVKLVKRLHKDEVGQDLVEYALIAAVIAAGSVATLSALGEKVNSELARVGPYLT